jgi:hypothetical protein
LSDLAKTFRDFPKAVLSESQVKLLVAHLTFLFEERGVNEFCIVKLKMGGLHGGWSAWG